MLSVIEEKFKIEYPPIYKSLFEDGMLDWGELGPDWSKIALPKFRKHPPFLLFSGDFKIIDARDLVSYTEKVMLNRGEYHAAIPFGKTGAGEPFCLLFAGATRLDSVCKINRRSEEGVKVAKSLEDFIFRQLLGAVVQINQDDLEDKQLFFSDLNAMLGSHKKYLSALRFDLIQEIYSRPLSTSDPDEIGTITLDTFYEILSREISFDQFDKKISMPTQA